MESKERDNIITLTSYKQSLFCKVVSCLLIFTFTITNITYGADRSDIENLRRVAAQDCGAAGGVNKRFGLDNPGTGKGPKKGTAKVACTSEAFNLEEFKIKILKAAYDTARSGGGADGNMLPNETDIPPAESFTVNQLCENGYAVYTLPTGEEFLFILEEEEIDGPYSKFSISAFDRSDDSFIGYIDVATGMDGDIKYGDSKESVLLSQVPPYLTPQTEAYLGKNATKIKLGLLTARKRKEIAHHGLVTGDIDTHWIEEDAHVEEWLSSLYLEKEYRSPSYSGVSETLIALACEISIKKGVQEIRGYAGEARRMRFYGRLGFKPRQEGKQGEVYLPLHPGSKWPQIGITRGPASAPRSPKRVKRPEDGEAQSGDGAAERGADSNASVSISQLAHNLRTAGEGTEYIRGLYKEIAHYFGIKGIGADIGACGNYMPAEGLILGGVERCYRIDIGYSVLDRDIGQVRGYDGKVINFPGDATNLHFDDESLDFVVFHQALVWFTDELRWADWKKAQAVKEYLQENLDRVKKVKESAAASEELAGYIIDRTFAEAFRVLKPGGKILIKPGANDLCADERTQEVKEVILPVLEKANFVNVQVIDYKQTPVFVYAEKPSASASVLAETMKGDVDMLLRLIRQNRDLDPETEKEIEVHVDKDRIAEDSDEYEIMENCLRVVEELSGGLITGEIIKNGDKDNGLIRIVCKKKNGGWDENLGVPDNDLKIGECSIKIEGSIKTVQRLAPLFIAALAGALVPNADKMGCFEDYLRHLEIMDETIYALTKERYFTEEELALFTSSDSHIGQIDNIVNGKVRSVNLPPAQEMKIDRSKELEVWRSV